MRVSYLLQYRVLVISLFDQDPEVYPFQDWGSPTGKDCRAVPPSLRSHGHGRHRPFQSHGTLQRPLRRSPYLFGWMGKHRLYHWSFMTCSTQVSNRIFVDNFEIFLVQAIIDVHQFQCRCWHSCTTASHSFFTPQALEGGKRYTKQRPSPAIIMSEDLTTYAQCVANNSTGDALLECVADGLDEVRPLTS